MSSADYDRLDRGKAANEAGHTTAVYALLLPPAEAGHDEAQRLVGGLMTPGLRRRGKSSDRPTARP